MYHFPVIFKNKLDGKPSGLLAFEAFFKQLENSNPLYTREIIIAKKLFKIEETIQKIYNKFTKEDQLKNNESTDNYSLRLLFGIIKMYLLRVL